MSLSEFWEPTLSDTRLFLAGDSVLSGWLVISGMSRDGPAGWTLTDAGVVQNPGCGLSAAGLYCEKDTCPALLEGKVPCG